MTASEFSQGNQLLRSNQLEEAVAVYQKAIALHPNFHWSHYKLGEALEQLGRLEEAMNAYNKALSLQPINSSYIIKESLDSFWQYLNQPNIDWDGHYDFHQSLDMEIVKGHFMETSRYHEIGLKRIDSLQNNSKLIEKLQIKSWETFCDNIRQIAHMDSNYSIYQFKLDAIKNGYLESICPWSGEVVKSNHSFIVSASNRDNGNHCVFAYRFNANNTYYIFVGFQRGFKMFIYLPSAELIITIIDMANRQGLVSQLKSYMVFEFSETIHYLLDSQDKKLVAITGVTNHPGHVFLNEYPSYHQLSQENNLLDTFDKYLIGPYEFVPFENFLPEINIKKVIKKQDYSDSFTMFEYALKNNYFIIHPTNWSYNLNRGIAKRIYSASVKSSSETCLPEIEVAKKYFPVLWFEIKTNHRIWLNQAEGIAEIANRLYSDYPNLAIILAGWSCLDSDNSSDHRWIEKDKQLVEESRALIAPNIPTFAVVGYKIYEKIAWAGAADIHIVGYGSATTFASIADKPIIMHCNKAQSLESLKSWTKSAHPGLSHISVVDSQYISDENLKGNYLHRNYYCSWEGIYQEIVKALNTLNLSDKIV